MKHIYFLLLLALSCPCLGQPRSKLLVLSGKVLDENHQPIPGANLALLQTGYQAVSKADGSFEFDVPAGTYVLRTSFVGYKNFDLPLTVPLSRPLVIELQRAANELQEVVVSTGYQTIPMERATGSFVRVDNELLNRSVSTDIIDRLNAVVPGLSFNSVGTRISIRGQSTLFSNADPLIVVDGFPYNQPIENLNPNDVESITVLKDAAAASIWGSKAGNGVIVVTTKRGSFNRPLQVSFNGNITVGERPNLNYPSRMSTSDYIDLEKRLFNEGYYQGLEGALGHPPLSPVTELLIAQRDGLISSGDANRHIDALKQQDVRGDISRYLYRKKVYQQYALNLSGGSSTQRYFFSVGADRNLDNLVGNNFDRITLNGNNTWTMLQNRLEFSIGANLTQKGTDQNSPGSLTWNRGNLIYPYAALVDASGNALSYTKDYRQDLAAGAAKLGLLDWQYKPVDELRLADNTAKVTDLRLNTALTYKIIPGLNAQVLYQYDHSLSAGRNLHSANSYFTRNLVNRFTQDNGSGLLTLAAPTGGILDIDNSTSVNHDIRGQLNYDHFFSKSSLTAITGYEVQTLHVLGDAYRFYGYDPEHATAKPVDGITQFTYYDNASTGGSIPLNVFEADATDHYRSYYANAAWTYDRRYTLSGSGRLDQSNLFGVRTNQKGVPLWSAGAAWNINQEGFYPISWLPELKVRATFGYNGNINKSLSAYTTANYLDGSDSQTRLPYARIANPPNPDLRWERIRNINFALDFATTNHRLSGTFEYYLKKGIDLIGNTAYPASSGITLFTGNTAQTTGRGLDFNLESRNFDGAFKWVTNFFVSYVTDKVTTYDQESTAATYLAYGDIGGYPLLGKPFYAVYSYRSAGLDPKTGDPQGYLNGAVTNDYNAILTTATPGNLVYNGPSRPVVFGALRNTFVYHAVSLSVNVSYKLGYYFRRTSVRYGTDYGLSQQSGDYGLRWQKSGDEGHTVVPSLPTAPDSQRDDFYTYSSALVEKGDHVRLQDMNLSWTVPKGKVRFLPGRNLQLYLYAANLGIIWRANRYHLDPDLPYTYPAPRTISAGLRCTL